MLRELLASTKQDLDYRFRRIAEQYVPLLKFLGEDGKTLLPAVETVSNFVLRADLSFELMAEVPNIVRLRMLFEEAKTKSNLFTDTEAGYSVKRCMEKLMTAITANPSDLSKIQLLRQVAELVIPIPLDLNLWEVQNLYWEMFHWQTAEYKAKALAGDKEAQTWLKEFLQIGKSLGFAV